MRSTARWLLPVALAALTLFDGAPAQADEWHFEDFRYGRRALSMGGAVVAWPGEPETVYYNPAGLALLGGVQFSGSLHFYGLDRRRLVGGLRDAGFFEPRDQSAREIFVSPSSSVTSFRLFGKRHTFALASFLTSATDEQFTGRFTLDPADEILGVPIAEVTGEQVRLDRINITGVGYAYTLSDTISIGITGFYALHKRRNSVRRSLVLRPFRDEERELLAEFIDIGSREDTKTGSVFARLGIIWTPSPALSTGLACSTPSIPINGTTRLRYTLIFSGFADDEEDGEPIYLDDSATLPGKTVLPFRCRGGVSWRISDTLRLNIDTSVVVPIDFERFPLDPNDPETADLARIWPPNSRGEVTVNGMMGLEWWAGSSTPVRFGLFTNRTTAPELQPTSRSAGPPHIDLYGVTLGVGQVGERYAVNVGAELQGGVGHDRSLTSLEGALAEPVYARIERQQWRLLLFVSGAISFAKVTAREVLRDITAPAAEAD